MPKIEFNNMDKEFEKLNLKVSFQDYARTKVAEAIAQERYKQNLST
jgi:hypothetical protein